DLYVLRGEGGNTSVYLTDEGVILVDVKFERNFDDIQAKVKSLTDKPVRYIINTHAHGDHTGGNQKFLPTTQIIAHRNARDCTEPGRQGSHWPLLRPCPHGWRHVGLLSRSEGAGRRRFI